MADQEINHPGYGKWDYDPDHFEPRSGGGCNIKCGFVCQECHQSVLAYKQPKKCSDHED